MKTDLIGEVRVHQFDSTGEAYDCVQAYNEIRSGDLLWIPSEGVLGVADTWPTAVTRKHGKIHQIDERFQDWGSLPNAYGVGAAGLCVLAAFRHFLNLEFETNWGKLVEGIAAHATAYEEGIFRMVQNFLACGDADGPAPSDEEEDCGDDELLRLEGGEWHEGRQEWYPSGTGFITMPHTEENIVACSVIMGLAWTDITWALEEHGEVNSREWRLDFVPKSMAKGKPEIEEEDEDEEDPDDAMPYWAWMHYECESIMEDAKGFETTQEAWRWLIDECVHADILENPRDVETLIEALLQMQNGPGVVKFGGLVYGVSE